MKTSDRGLDLIKQFEGFRAEAYQDVVGVWTIGWGHTRGVRAGMTVTRQQAEGMLRAELEEYEAAVSQAARSPTQNQFDALVSFAYNVGIAGMRGSSVIRAHNRRDQQAAARAFALWNKAGGKVWPGLTRRRAAEAALYLEPERRAVDAPAEDMPQAVEAESTMLRSPIATAGTATAAVSGIGAAAQVAGDVAAIRESLGPWLPYIALGAAIGAIGFGLYIVAQRIKQRNGGWA